MKRGTMSTCRHRCLDGTMRIDLSRNSIFRIFQALPPPKMNLKVIRCDLFACSILWLEVYPPDSCSITHHDLSKTARWRPLPFKRAYSAAAAARHFLRRQNLETWPSVAAGTNTRSCLPEKSDAGPSASGDLSGHEYWITKLTSRRWTICGARMSRQE